jgi:hypothetical protein
MAGTFATFGELPESLGFDDAVTPPWTMVPNSGARKIVLRDGQGLTLAA